jgi:hypothetical protein
MCLKITLYINLKVSNMKKSLKTNLIFFALTAAAAVFMYACGDDNIITNTPNTPAVGTMSGTITFFDTNRVYSGGNYDVSVYSSWPPTGPPAGSSAVTLTKNGNVYTGTYSIPGLTSGANYVTVAAWIKTPYGPGAVYVSGLRGCDTNAACFFANPTRDTLPSSQGLENLNFNADLDTSKMQVRF